MKKQQPQSLNPIMDAFNQPPPGSAYKIITAEQFRQIQRSEPHTEPWLVTNEFGEKYHSQTLILTDCSHYFVLNAQTKNLLCRSYTDKISCPNHTGICFGCRKTVCTSGDPDGLPLEIEPGVVKWFCLDCYKPTSKKLNRKRFFQEFMKGFFQ